MRFLILIAILGILTLGVGLPVLVGLRRGGVDLVKRTTSRQIVVVICGICLPIWILFLFFVLSIADIDTPREEVTLPGADEYFWMALPYLMLLYCLLTAFRGLNGIFYTVMGILIHVTLLSGIAYLVATSPHGDGLAASVGVFFFLLGGLWLYACWPQMKSRDCSQDE